MVAMSKWWIRDDMYDLVRPEPSIKQYKISDYESKVDNTVKLMGKEREQKEET